MMIRARNLSKRFRSYNHPLELVKELATFKKRHTVLNVLDNVSFDVARGECVGIVGPNGCGKSTLLKILIGVLLPNSGTVDIAGRITGLLELGTGFNQEMTGLQNIYMNGLLLGMTRGEIDQRRERIIEFTELGEFIKAPLKTYSSGMIMRLAFSVAIHADPSCFVIDEALAVGDAHFQQKCFRKILEFKESGGCILFVSHDMHTVKRLCDRAMLLHGGSFQHEGEPDEVVNQYNYLLSRVHDSLGQVRREGAGDLSYGTFEARITGAACLGRHSGSPIIGSGEDAVITIGVRAEKDLDDVTCGVTVRDQFGQDMFGTNTWLHGMRVSLKAGREYRIAFRAPMAFGEGKYAISPALHTGPDHVAHCYHWMENAASFEVVGSVGYQFLGTCNLRPEIEVRELGGTERIVARAGWKPEVEP